MFFLSSTRIRKRTETIHTHLCSWGRLIEVNVLAAFIPGVETKNLHMENKITLSNFPTLL